MTIGITRDGRVAASTDRTAAYARAPDDAAMLRAAADLTRDLNAARPAIYWGDFIGSAVIGYSAFAGAVLATAWPLTVVSAMIAVLALYRAGSFIHELTHIKHASLPWFRFGWNVLIGVPMLIPSFMYEGVHNLHHARTRYGTIDDPEYLPLARMRPWTLPVFVLAAILAPLALIVRFALLTPLSLLSPSLRRMVVARFSGLKINPAFERRPPEGALKRQWWWQESAASLWALAIIVLVATGFIPWRTFAFGLGIASAVLLLNQVRTLVAHLWENEGDAMTVTAQYLDSVNVPPPSPLAALWAPVGLRYHATHHLLPSLPYHALAEAHRRLRATVSEDSPYHSANYSGLSGLVVRLARGSGSF